MLQYAPDGRLIGATIDNRPGYGAPRRWQGLINGQMTGGYSGGDGWQTFDDEPAAFQAPDPTQQMAQQYRAQAAKGFVQRLTGDAEIQPLESDPMINDRRWQNLYSQNPQEAEALFERARGYGLADAQNAKLIPRPEVQAQGPPSPQGGYPVASGPQTINSVRNYAALQKQSGQFLNDFEKNFGINPGGVLEDFDFAASGQNPRGYDSATSLFHVPGAAVRDPATGDYVNKPGRQMFIPPNAVQAVRRQMMQRGMYSPPTARIAPTTALPQAVAPAALNEEAQRKLARMRQLEAQEAEEAMQWGGASKGGFSFPGF